MSYIYKYPRPAVTADCVVITLEAVPRVLLIQRGNEPFKGSWAFPGGFMNMDETTEECAVRELEEETGVRISGLHQIGAFSKIDRDPRGRTITVAYLAIVNQPLDARGMDDAKGAAWFPMNKLPKLAFDHEEMLCVAKEEVRKEILLQTKDWQEMTKGFTKEEVEKIKEWIGKK